LKSLARFDTLPDPRGVKVSPEMILEANQPVWLFQGSKQYIQIDAQIAWL